jgi:RHS repeat-associated protein
VGRYDYTAFGTLKYQTGPDVCRFKFSTRERDTSTGFGYYGYRFYAPQWQRWTNRDPLQEESGLNLYAYVENSPNSLVDKDGLQIAKPFPRVAIPRDPVSCAFTVGVIIGSILYWLFPDTMTKPGECIGNMICPPKTPKWERCDKVRDWVDPKTGRRFCTYKCAISGYFNDEGTGCDKQVRYRQVPQ